MTGLFPWGLPRTTDVTYFRPSRPRTPGGTWSRRGRRWPRCLCRHSGAGRTPPGMGRPGAGVSRASEEQRAPRSACSTCKPRWGPTIKHTGVRGPTGGQTMPAPPPTVDSRGQTFHCGGQPSLVFHGPSRTGMAPRPVGGGILGPCPQAGGPQDSTGRAKSPVCPSAPGYSRPSSLPSRSEERLLAACG